MTIEELWEAQKTAMKAGDKTRLAVVKAVRQTIHATEIAETRKATDADVGPALKRVLAITKEERDVRANILGDKETRVLELDKQIEWLSSKLPRQATKEEIDTLVTAAVKEIGATSMRDMRAVLAHVRSHTEADVNGGMVSTALKAALAN